MLFTFVLATSCVSAFFINFARQKLKYSMKKKVILTLLAACATSSPSRASTS